jgi:hypothetical protein
MLLALWMLAVGVSLGVVIGATQVPRASWLEAACGTVLVLSGAVALVVLDPTNAVAGVAYALSVALSYALASGRAWQKALPEVQMPFLWFVRMAATRRSDLRRMRDAAGADPHPTA